jgi:hypothetical protein
MITAIASMEPERHGCSEQARVSVPVSVWQATPEQPPLLMVNHEFNVSITCCPFCGTYLGE